MTIMTIYRRRTRQSGPLGELFDHGVDALNTSLEVLIFSAAMNLGQGWKTILILFASLLTFYVQTWDEYHTHTLTLGIVSGPVEGIVTLCIIYAFTGYVGGGSFWNQSMFASLGMPHYAIIPDAVYELLWTDWYMAYGGVVLIFNTLLSAMNVMAARRARKEPPIPALYGLAPFFLTWTVMPLYLYLQPVILRQHLVPFVFYVGIVNAYSVGQMIVTHLTKSPFPMTNVLVLPLIVGVIDSLGPVLTEHVGVGWPSALGDAQYQVAYMFSCLGLAVGVYGSFVVDVIVTICDYLDIWCLTIKHPYVADDEEEKKTL
jgi:ethanolaminephosphotransferase